MQKKLHIKVGDAVKVIAGEALGQEGKVLTVDRKSLRATVEGLKMVKKHAKPSATDPQGGIIEKEGTIHISNLMLVVKGEATKVGRKLDKDGNMVRYAKKSGEEIK